MSKKLALTMIIAGAIGIPAGLLRIKNAGLNYQIIKEEIACNQIENNAPKELERNPRVMRNAMYGGLSAAATLASFFATIGGGYLLSGKDYFKEKE